MNIQNINRLNNEYRAYIYEAESHRITRAGVASREEGLSYQRAAQICGQLGRAEPQGAGQGDARCQACRQARRQKDRRSPGDCRPLV